MPGSSRLLSIDAFRGLTIAGMILVNDPGNWDAVYSPLEHAEWNGWTPTDLVFPFFLFLVGTSMVFSFSSRQEKGSTRRELLRHTIRRSLYIYGIGLALHLYPFTIHRIQHVRVMGVLGRIALCYFLASLIYLYVSRRLRIAITVSLLVGFWVILRFAHVPGFPTGDMTPFGNVAAYFDRLVLGTHLWKPMWDPEGLLSSLPAIATALLGTLCGEWLRAPRSQGSRVVGLFIAGVLGLATGELIHPYFPINKNLWTSTFVVFTAGFACVVLAVMYWVIDVKGIRRWVMPLEVFGANAILSYAVATLAIKQMLITFINGRSVQEIVYGRVFAPLASPKNSSLLFALAFTFTIWLIMLVFYRKRVFLKV
jgi:predicted acyltransferase